MSDDVIDKLFGKDARKSADNPYVELVGAEYSDSGNMLGNLYVVEVKRQADGSLAVEKRVAQMHSDPIEVSTYPADGDLLDRIDSIVTAAGAKTWGELPPSELIAHDASTPLVRLSYRTSEGFPEFLTISSANALPEGGREALYAIRDLIESYATEANRL